MDKATLGAVLGVAMGGAAGYGTSRYLLKHKSHLANMLAAAGGAAAGGGAGFTLGGAYDQGERENKAKARAKDQADRAETAKQEKLEAEKHHAARMARSQNSTEGRKDKTPRDGAAGYVKGMAEDTMAAGGDVALKAGVPMASLAALKGSYKLGDRLAANPANLEPATMTHPKSGVTVANPREGKLAVPKGFKTIADTVVYPGSKGVTAGRAIKAITKKMGWPTTLAVGAVMGVANQAPGLKEFYSNPIKNTMDIFKPTK